MNTRHCKLAAPLTFLLLMPTGGTWLWMRAQQRQSALNRQLIAALVKDDTGAAIALVNEGADPNTRYTPTPTPTLLSLVKQCLHRSPPPSNDSPTALMMACGAEWIDYKASYEESYQILHRKDALQLVEVMLTHNANTNRHDTFGRTALHWAVLTSVFGSGANKDIVRPLLAYKANPNLVDRKGDTPLRLAQRDKHPDLVILLKQAGARK